MWQVGTSWECKEAPLLSWDAARSVWYAEVASGGKAYQQMWGCTEGWGLEECSQGSWCCCCCWSGFFLSGIVNIVIDFSWF